MTTSVTVIVLIGFSFFAFVLGSLIWAYRNGQFENVEDVARRMLDVDE